jgi:hypothetical protein
LITPRTHAGAEGTQRHKMLENLPRQLARGYQDQGPRAFVIIRAAQQLL